jgi:methenyltetrahydromethanopterin cyclohydrolase
MLEGREFPGEEVAAFVAEKCAVSPEQLTLLIAPTASLVGSIQIAARSAETGLHKLVELGFDVRRVASAFGLCPLAPVAADDLHAIGRTNDAILYGGQVFYAVQAEDDELAALIERVPSSGSRDYGRRFDELFKRYNGDFYQIDPLLFSPAQVVMNNLNSGHTFRAGQLNSSLLQASLLES